MAYFISVKTRKGFKHIEVEEEVYIYVKQLEIAIKYPAESKLKETYHERFLEVKDDFRRSKNGRNI